MIFLTGLDRYYAARDGVDIDLLSRGAGFGYLGSTVTSFIYASFTLSSSPSRRPSCRRHWSWSSGCPLSIGYLISALAIIPLVTHGITLISRFQL